jgi:hypothetical protein
MILKRNYTCNFPVNSSNRVISYTNLLLIWNNFYLFFNCYSLYILISFTFNVICFPNYFIFLFFLKIVMAVLGHHSPDTDVKIRYSWLKPINQSCLWNQRASVYDICKWLNDSRSSILIRIVFLLYVVNLVRWEHIDFLKFWLTNCFPYDR